MTGFLVRVIEGPAAGWEYVTLIEPDPVIAIAPDPRRRDWMRVLVDDDAPWPGACFYEHTTLTSEGTVLFPVTTESGEELRAYRLAEEQPSSAPVVIVGARRGGRTAQHDAEVRQLCEEQSGYVVSSSCATLFFADRAAAEFYADWSARYTEEEMVVCEIQDGGGLHEVARYTPEQTDA